LKKNLNFIFNSTYEINALISSYGKFIKKLVIKADIQTLQMICQNIALLVHLEVIYEQLDLTLEMFGNLKNLEILRPKKFFNFDDSPLFIPIPLQNEQKWQNFLVLELQNDARLLLNPKFIDYMRFFLPRIERLSMR
jgi:hypothetical protein